MADFKGSLVKHIFYVVALLALISLTKYFVQWKANFEQNNQRNARAPFFIAHVLDPNVGA